MTAFGKSGHSGGRVHLLTSVRIFHHILLKLDCTICTAFVASAAPRTRPDSRALPSRSLSSINQPRQNRTRIVEFTHILSLPNSVSGRLIEQQGFDVQVDEHRCLNQLSAAA